MGYNWAVSDSVYIFLDEAGNLDFSTNGTRYFVLTSVSIRRPFSWFGALDEYKYDCLEAGAGTDVFHCSEDNRYVRDRVFGIIGANLDSFRVDSLVVEKRKTGPALREPTRFYPEMLGYLLKHVLPEVMKTNSVEVDEVTVITDRLPLNKRRRAIEKSIQGALSKMVPTVYNRYRILHHNSGSHYGLQVADYCCWAVFRSWEREDSRYYDMIKPAVRSEFDIFRNGVTHYY